LFSDRSFPLAGHQSTPNQPSHHTGRDAALVGGVGAAGIAAETAYKRHQPSGTSDPSTGQEHSLAQPSSTNTAGGNHGREGLASAAAATAFSHDHNGKGHTYRGDPCAPTSAAEISGPKHTEGPHATETANRLDPHNHGAQQIGEADSGMIGQHHHGRDAALLGAGAAGAAGTYEAGRHSDHTKPQADLTNTDSTAQPLHKSNLLNKLDPRVKSESDKTKDQIPGNAHNSSGSPETNPVESKDHHVARDAALVGGAGIAGAGAYAAHEKHHDEQPGAVGSVVSGERGVIGSDSNPYSSHTLDPRVDSPDHRKSTESTTRDPHHYGRDAAVAGGAGATGGAVYEAAKHHDRGHDASDPLSSSAHPKASDRYEGQRAIPHHPAHQVGHEPTQPTQASHEHHTGRDAAVVGTAGAAGLGAEHEFSKKEAEKLEKEKQKEFKQHEKDAAKAEKKHEKEIEKEHKKHEKEVEKEHKPSLISRILHRDKDKNKHDESIASDSKHHEEEAAVGAGAVGAGVATHEHNKLHKDPPKGHQQARDNTTGTGQHIGTDGQIGDVNKISGQQ
jgi:hypothetical protein